MAHNFCFTDSYDTVMKGTENVNFLKHTKMIISVAYFVISE
jgi:hypothetical protein